MAKWVRVLAGGAIIGGVSVMTSTFCAADRIDTGSGGSQPVAQLSQATQELYRQIANSMVRIRYDQTSANILPPEMIGDYANWRISQGMAVRDGRKKDSAPTTAPATLPARIMNQPGPLRRYLEQKIKDQPNAEYTPKLRMALAKMAGQGGEVYGVVIDTDGNVLVLNNGFHDGQPDTFKITTADGTEGTAKYVGADSSRGFAIIKLDSMGSLTPISLADGRPAPGELLMTTSARQATITWISTSARFGKKNPNAEERFPIPATDDRGPSYIFNANGQLAAIGLDRFGLEIDAIHNEMKWIIANHRDVAPRQLGVKYGPVPPTVRKSTPNLGMRPAVLVQDVTAGSPAERAGLKKDDIVLTIDKRPIWQLPQIQEDLATRNGMVPVGILRDDKEIILDLPLDQ